MNSVITAGLDSPAFSSDLSTWKLEIAADGLLTQQIRQLDRSHPYPGIVSTRSRHLSELQLTKIFELAEGVDFFNLPDRLEAEVTDQQSVHISVSIDGRTKKVEVYGPFFLAMRRDEAPGRHVRKFVELWEEIVRHVDYPATNHLTLEALDQAGRREGERKRLEDEKRQALQEAAESRGALKVVTLKNGFALCPHCGARFALYSTMSWDGARHKTCGTLLKLPTCVEGLRTREDFAGIQVQDGVLMTTGDLDWGG